MQVAKCGGCEELFEVPHGHPTDTIQRPEGIMRSGSILLCPGCRVGASARGQEPAQEEEREE